MICSGRQAVRKVCSCLFGFHALRFRLVEVGLNIRSHVDRPTRQFFSSFAFLQALRVHRFLLNWQLSLTVCGLACR